MITYNSYFKYPNIFLRTPGNLDPTVCLLMVLLGSAIGTGAPWPALFLELVAMVTICCPGQYNNYHQGSTSYNNYKVLN